MKRMTAWAIGGAIALMCLAGSPHAAAERLALVIGNNDYDEITSLHKAVADSEAMAATLEQVGFEVIHAQNLNRREMNRRLQEFLSRLSVGDEAVFFFAGHGIEFGGRNYLLPTDIPAAQPGQDNFVRSEAIPVDEVLDQIQLRGPRVSILMLDACRDNPFPRNGTRSVGGSRGLARIEAPAGTFVMYSAGVGQSALDRLSDDDPHPNSVFTRSLIPLIKRPDVSLVEAARQVRRDVEELANSISHQQRPAYYDEISGEFFFAKAAATPTGGEASLLDAVAERVWLNIQNSTSPAILRTFAADHPVSPYAALALARAHEIETTGPGTGSVGHEPADPPTAEPVDPAVLPVAAVQSELGRLGCKPGAADGIWGRNSQQALMRFAESSGVSLPSLEPSEAVLRVLRGVGEAVCIRSAARTETSEPSASDAAWSCVALSVRVANLDPDGLAWDSTFQGDPEPDVVVSERNSGFVSQECTNSHSCSVRFTPSGTRLDLTIVDADVLKGDEHIGAGTCALRAGTCNVGRARVTVQRCG